MTIDVMSQILNALIRGTLVCVCTGFCFLGLIGVWKWFFGVAQRILYAMFPALKAWCEKRPIRAKEERCIPFTNMKTGK